MIYKVALEFALISEGIFSSSRIFDYANIINVRLHSLVNGENAKYFTPRLIGIYAIIITVLVFSHVSYIKVNQLEIKNILCYYEGKILTYNKIYTRLLQEKFL